MQEISSSPNQLVADEYTKLKAAKSAEEWDEVCDEIKAARGGQYPSDWYQRVILSGFAASVQMNWF